MARRTTGPLVGYPALRDELIRTIADIKGTPRPVAEPDTATRLHFVPVTASGRAR